MITLGDYLIVSGILFVIGFAGVMLRRNLIIILMSLELMLNAANFRSSLFAFRLDSIGLPNYNVQVFVFFIITVAAAEVAVGLAILVALYRTRQTTDVNNISSLKFNDPMNSFLPWIILLAPQLAQLSSRCSRCDGKR